MVALSVPQITPRAPGTTGAPRGDRPSDHRVSRSRRWLVHRPRVAMLVVTAALAVAGYRHLSDVVDRGLTPGATAASALAITAFVVGTPHGAADVTRLGRTPWAFARNGILYFLCAVAVGLVWFVAPAATLIALLLVSAVHFGLGDVEVSDETGDAAPRRTLHRVSTVVALGGAPVVVPIGLHGHAVLRILDVVGGGQGQLVIAFCRWAILVVVLAGLMAVASSTGPHRRDVAVDIGVVGIVAAVLSPLLAFAVYFALWHTWRQSGLLVRDEARRRGISPIRAGTVLLIVSVVPSLVAGAAALLAITTCHLPTIGAALVTVLSLTVPHCILSMRQRDLGSTGRGAPRALHGR